MLEKLEDEYGDKKFTTGSLITLEIGEYSSYQVLGFFVVLNEFFPIEQTKKYFEMYPEQREFGEYNKDKFIYFLLYSGFLMEVRHGIFYLGGYNDVDDMSVVLESEPLELDLEGLGE